MTLSELIAELEKAPGPSRELDLALANSILDESEPPWDWYDRNTDQVWRGQHVGVCTLERFTSCTEEAAVLVPAGLDWSVRSTADGAFATVLTLDGTEHEGAANTPANALCIAALRAIQAEKERE